MGNVAPIFLISGSPGAGKTTTAGALARRFKFGMHIPMDNMRDMVVAGRASPLPKWTDETTRQFHLARENACHVARSYAEQGFAVVIDDVIGHQAFDLFDRCLAPIVPTRVFLCPPLEVVQKRNVSRTHPEFDYAILKDLINDLYQPLKSSHTTAAGWLVIDNSELTVDQTVDAILTAAPHSAFLLLSV